MAHELAGAFQQAGRIRQRYAVKEPHVHVRSEYIDVPEGRISQTCDRTAVMQKLPDFVPAFSHRLKPLICDGSQSICMLFYPRIDGGIALDSAVESQQFRSHHRSTFLFRNLSLHSTLTRGTKGRRRSTDCDRIGQRVRNREQSDGFGRWERAVQRSGLTPPAWPVL